MFLGTGAEPHAIFRVALPLVSKDSLQGSLLAGVLWLAVGLTLKQTSIATAQTLGLGAAARIVTHVRTTIAANLVNARFSYLDSLRTGVPRQIVVAEAAKFQPATSAFVNMAGSVFSTTLLLGLLLAISPALTGVLLLVILPLAPLKLRLTLEVHRSSRIHLDSKLDLMDKLNEVLLGIRQVKLLNLQRQFLAGLVSASRNTERHFRRAKLLTAWEPVFVLTATLGSMLVIRWLGRTLDLAPVDQMLAFFFALFQAVPHLNKANLALNNLLKARPSLVVCAKYFTLPPASLEPEADVEWKSEPIAHLAFRRVSFQHATGNDVLREVSLEARRGELVAVVGESGAGKSTLAHLLLGMYPVTSGAILLDGKAVANLDAAQIRASIAFMTQDLHLFNTTIEEVIRAGSSTLTVTEVERAASDAEADSFIASLPKGYGTKVGERGVRLSGGQRQRLILAQIYARGTSVVMLDEATSALDLAVEKRILENLSRHKRDKIILIISHRLASLEVADRIYVLEHGRVTESGTWSELMEERGAFWRLSQRETSGSSDERKGGAG